MLGYTLDDLDKTTACSNIAHEIIDGPAEVRSEEHTSELQSH